MDLEAGKRRKNRSVAGDSRVIKHVFDTRHDDNNDDDDDEVKESSDQSDLPAPTGAARQPYTLGLVMGQGTMTKNISTSGSNILTKRSKQGQHLQQVSMYR